MHSREAEAPIPFLCDPEDHTLLVSMPSDETQFQYKLIQIQRVSWTYFVLEARSMIGLMQRTRKSSRCTLALSQLSWIDSIPHPHSTLYEGVEDLALKMKFPPAHQYPFKQAPPHEK
eukprot:347524-Pelagomonas_calceolata.AAC.3